MLIVHGEIGVICLMRRVINLAPMKEKRVSGSLPEWINNSDYSKLSEDRDYLFSKAQKTEDPEDWTAAKSLTNRVNNLGKSLKRDYCTKAMIRVRDQSHLR